MFTLPKDIPVFEGLGLFLTAVLLTITIRLASNSDNGDKNNEDNENNKIKRKLSFSSFNLISGSFPPQTKVVPPIVNNLCIFDKYPTEENIYETLEKFFYYDRFRSKVVLNKNGSYALIKLNNNIIKDKKFLSQLIIKHKINNENEFFNCINDICAQDLYINNNNNNNNNNENNENNNNIYNNLPAFRLHFISNNNNNNNNNEENNNNNNKNIISAVIIRIHHVIGDGMSMVGAMSHVFREKSGDFCALDFIPEKKNSGDGIDNNHNKMNSNNKMNKRNIFLLGLDFIISFFRVILIPLSAYDSNIIYTDPNKSKLIMTKTRKIVYFPSVQLAIIKAIKNKAKVTLNDVMLSVTSGAIKRYCEHFNDPLLKSSNLLQNRALIPFAFPRTMDIINNPTIGMRNYWAFLSVPLPIILGDKILSKHKTESLSRLYECHKTTVALKSSPLAYLTLWVQNNLLPLLPKFMAQQTALDLFKRHTMVFSNVPGPLRPVYFCGERIIGIQAIFPNLLPQVILMSYCDVIFSNMVLDDELIKDCDLLRQYYLDEIFDLCCSLDITLEPINGKISTDSLLGTNKNKNFNKFELINVPE